MSMRLMVWLALAALLLLTACNKGNSSQADAGGTADTADKAQGSVNAGDKTPSVEGTSLTLASGAALTVEAVAEVDKDPAGHSGLVAVEGRVLQVFPEKSAFTMTDYGTEICVENPGCTS